MNIRGFIIRAAFRTLETSVLVATTSAGLVAGLFLVELVKVKASQ